MAILRTIKCSRCSYVMLQGIGTSFYVNQSTGVIKRLLGIPAKKVFLPEPPVSRLPGSLDIEKARAENRLHSVTPRFCRQCHYIFPVYSDAGSNSCPKCESPETLPVFDMIGDPCPKCKTGTIVDNHIGIT